MSIVLLHAVATVVASAAAVDPQPGTLWLCCWEGENVLLTKELRDQYDARFKACVVAPEKKDEVEQIITRIMKNRGRYENVEARTSVPWFIIALLHNMECDGNFNCHLHNGDPLHARTVNEPKGRPLRWSANGTWEESADDALLYDGFDVWHDWETVSGALFKIEVYNGWGYQMKSIPSPYLWGSSSIYSRGKFVSDGHFDPNAVSQQIGAAVLLRRMIDQHLVDLPIGGQTAAVQQPASGGSK